jgi:hypothetical protein
VYKYYKILKNCKKWLNFLEEYYMGGPGCGVFPPTKLQVQSGRLNKIFNL